MDPFTIISLLSAANGIGGLLGSGGGMGRSMNPILSMGGGGLLGGGLMGGVGGGVHSLPSPLKMLGGGGLLGK